MAVWHRALLATVVVIALAFGYFFYLRFIDSANANAGSLFESAVGASEKEVPHIHTDEQKQRLMDVFELTRKPDLKTTVSLDKEDSRLSVEDRLARIRSKDHRSRLSLEGTKQQVSTS